MRVGEALHNHQSNSVLPIVACSALTKRYRGVIRNANQRVLFIYLKVPLEVAHKRVLQRQQHFFSAALIESQFATLEAPVELELDCLTVDATLSIESIVESLVKILDAMRIGGEYIC